MRARFPFVIAAAIILLGACSKLIGIDGHYTAASDEPEEGGTQDGAAGSAGSEPDGSVDAEPDRADGQEDSSPEANPEASVEAGPCSAIASFDDGLTPARVLHVSPSGSDTTGTGSEQSPFATIARAAREVTPGTAIRVHQGRYPGGIALSNLQGSASAPIWIGGAPGEAKPVLEGGDAGIHLFTVRYVIVHDLEVTRFLRAGINCDDAEARDNIDAARYVIFRRLSIHDGASTTGGSCLKSSGINDFQILDCQLSNCGIPTFNRGIDQTGCHNGLIARNTISNTDSGAVRCQGGCFGIEIRANRITSGGDRVIQIGGTAEVAEFRPPLSSSSTNTEAKDMRVIANLLIGGNASVVCAGCLDSLIAQNTVIDPARNLMRILQEHRNLGQYDFAAAGQGRVVNNLMFFTSAVTPNAVNVGDNTDGASFQFQTNLWFAHDQPGASTPTLPSIETGAVLGQDPAFANAAAGDYSIGATSPAARAGTALPEASSDLSGACYSSPPSIGAFQAP